jgi:hypothetical protein
MQFSDTTAGICHVFTVLVRRSCDEERIEVMTVATLVARNAKEATVAPTVGSGGAWSQAVGFVSVSSAAIWLHLPLRCFQI